jgi:hypothetical protein
MTKSDIYSSEQQFQNLKICQILSFFCIPKYNILDFKFCMVVELIIVNTLIYKDFFETLKCRFLHVARSTKIHSQSISILSCWKHPSMSYTFSFSKT